MHAIWSPETTVPDTLYETTVEYLPKVSAKNGFSHIDLLLQAHLDHVLQNGICLSETAGVNGT